MKAIIFSIVKIGAWNHSHGKFKNIRVKIEKRLERVRIGNLGDYLSVGEGVCELKIDFGPGYRIYFAQVGTKIILILFGGSKKTQEQDIEKAKEYSRDYERRESTNQ
jgi:putative addiction module killer protein